MPVSVRKSKGDSKIGSSHYDIVETATGKVKGHSRTMKDAKASARIRNAAISKKRKK